MKNSLKTLAFYSVSTVFSLVLAIVALEIFLRQLDYTTGTGVGSAHKRWMEKEWSPINELGFRDYALTRSARNTLPNIFFLGDSFTAGHGVGFEKTYYHTLRDSHSKNYNFFNLSRNSASTRSEILDLLNFMKQTRQTASIVVHQYFGNDIADYVQMKPWAPPSKLVALSQYSEIADFILSYLQNEKFGQRYKQSIYAAYQDNDTLLSHLNDIRKLHEIIHAQGGNMLVVAFPHLPTNETIRESGFYVRILRDLFTSNCKPGDYFLDVSNLATPLEPRKRTVNFLDPHPSPLMHKQVALALSPLIAGHSKGRRPSGAHVGTTTCPPDKGY